MKKCSMGNVGIIFIFITTVLTLISIAKLNFYVTLDNFSFANILKTSFLGINRISIKEEVKFLNHGHFYDSFNECYNVTDINVLKLWRDSAEVICQDRINFTNWKINISNNSFDQNVTLNEFKNYTVEETIKWLTYKTISPNLFTMTEFTLLGFESQPTFWLFHNIISLKYTFLSNSFLKIKGKCVGITGKTNNVYNALYYTGILGVNQSKSSVLFPDLFANNQSIVNLSPYAVSRKWSNRSFFHFAHDFINENYTELPESLPIVVEVSRLYPFNPFHLIQSVLNVYMTFSVLNLIGFNHFNNSRRLPLTKDFAKNNQQHRVVFVFEDYDGYDKEKFDYLFWRNIGNQEHGDSFMDSGKVYNSVYKLNLNNFILYSNFIRISSSFVSLFSFDTPPLGGYYRNHHCKSTVVLSAMRWIKYSLGFYPVFGVANSFTFPLSEIYVKLMKDLEIRNATRFYATRSLMLNFLPAILPDFNSLNKDNNTSHNLSFRKSIPDSIFKILNVKLLERGKEVNKRRLFKHIFWSSRAPFILDGKVTNPPRHFIGEHDFLEQVVRKLEINDTENIYLITSVNFGLVNANESIFLVGGGCWGHYQRKNCLKLEESVDNNDINLQSSPNVLIPSGGANILIGAHGAAFAWSLFLPRHAGVIEIFGGDRGKDFRVYHNIASLNNLHYREFVVSNFTWDEKLVDDIVNAIVDIGRQKQDIEPS